MLSMCMVLALKVIKRMNDHRTLVGRYMHDRTWGFEWGRPEDEVQFVRSSTMELVGSQNNIDVVPYDKEEVYGAREFVISFP